MSQNQLIMKLVAVVKKMKMKLTGMWPVQTGGFMLYAVQGNLRICSVAEIQNTS